MSERYDRIKYEKDGSGVFPTDQRELRLEKMYNESGQWARHYSTVRMTIGTFFLGIALATIQFRWEAMNVVAFICVLIASGFGCIVFWMFSYYTFQSLRTQIKIANTFIFAFRTSDEAEINLPSSNAPHWQGLLLGAVPAAIVTLVAGVLLANSFGADTTTDENRSLTVQVGNAEPVQVDPPAVISVDHLENR